MEWTTQQGRAESAWQRYGTACMPWLTAAVGLAFTLWLAWMLHSLHSQRVEDRIRHEAIHVAGEFRARMEEQTKALQRMAERWNHDAIRQPLLWLRDARHYLADFPPYHAITLVYADGSVCCSVTDQGAVVGGDLAAVAGVAVGGQGAFFTTAGLDNGEAGLLYVVPLAEGDMLVGIFSIPRLLTFTVDHSVRGGHLLSVAQAHRVIHAPAAVQGLDPSISRPVDLSLPGLPWEGRLWQTPEEVATYHSDLPFLVGSGGLALSVLLALLVEAWLRVQRHNRAITTEVARRREVEDLLRAVTDNVPAVLSLKDVTGRFLLLNRRFCETFHLDTAKALGGTDHDFFGPEQATAFRANDKQVMEAKCPVEFEEVMRQDDGLHTYRAIKFPVLDGQGQVQAIGCVATDITLRKQAEDAMRLLAAVFHASAEAIMVTDSDGIIEDVNAAFEETTGYSRQEAVGRNASLLQSGRHEDEFYRRMWRILREDGHWQGEIWDRRKSGEVYPKWVCIDAIRKDDGRIAHYVAIFHDISEMKRTEERLNYLANHDTLTELPNRFLFRDRLQQALIHASRDGGGAALMLLDLDRFKQVNDRFGHQKGDVLLVEAARRLMACVRKGDTLARLGGDEFAVVLRDVTDAAAIAEVARKIVAALEEPFSIDAHEASIAVSIGISRYPANGSDMDSLIRGADIAMYRAKQEGGNRYCFYADDMDGVLE